MIIKNVRLTGLHAGFNEIIVSFNEIICWNENSHC